MAHPEYFPYVMNVLHIFVFQEEEDLPYEEEILRNPFSVKCWLRYIDFKKGGTNKAINLIYERSLKELPGRLVIVIGITIVGL